MIARPVSIALAGLAAVAAWLTVGIQAVTDGHAGVRAGRLPPWWLLLLLLTAFLGPVLVRRISPARLWPLGLSALLWLPWLPGPVPAAFSIWSGPLTVVIWGAVALGLAWPWVQGRQPPRWAVDPSRAPAALSLAIFTACVAGAWTLQARLPAGDEPHYLIIAQSLLADGDLRIENNHANGDYFAYQDQALPPDYIERGADGQIYSIHAPGVSALVAPAFAVAGWPGAVSLMALLAAMTAAVMWRAAWELTGDAAAAWVAGTGFALGAPGYFHGFTIFPDGAAALPVAIALLALVRLDQRRDVPVNLLGGVGAALALLPWLHTRFAVLAGGLGLILLLRVVTRPDRVRAGTWLMIVPVVSAAAWFGFFWAIWGTPNPAAPYGRATQSAWAHLQPGIPGLLFDQQFGLLPNAPVYVAALAGLATLARWRPRLAAELAVLFVTYVTVVASYRMWWGGHSTPARFLVAALPALVLALAAWWARGRAARRSLTLALLAISVAMVVARLVIDEGALLYNERDGRDLLLAWLHQSVDLPLAWPSFHRGPVLEGLLDVLVWALAGTGLCAGSVWVANRIGQAWTLHVAAIAATVMVSTTIVWDGRPERLTVTASTVDLLRHWHAVSGPGWRSTHVGPVPAAEVVDGLVIRSDPRWARSRPTPLFASAGLPRGIYELVLEGRDIGGQVALRIGQSALALDVLALASREVAGAPLHVSVPVEVRDVTLTGDAQARDSVGQISLRPLEVGLPPRTRPGARRASRLVAHRATRYGDVRVFFADDHAFMEAPGFWTRASSATTLVIDRGEPDGRATPTAPGFLVRAGPVPTTTVLSSGDWRVTLALQPGATEVVQLPDDRAGEWVVRVETGEGFRPAQHDRQAQDWRNLGVWIEVAP